jgi:hypothetical protein
MSHRTINLSIKCSPFMTTNHRNTLTGFLFHYNNVIYLLSVHHHLPIEHIYELNTESPCNILVNSCWCETVIMDTHNIDTHQFTVFRKFQNSIKSYGKSTIYTIIDGERNIIKDIETTYESFDCFNQSPELPYIIGKLELPKESIAGNSGSPVFISEGNEDILIGVITKYDINSKYIYIIPIYIFIKCFEKYDNSTIYGLEDYTNVTKIGAYYISDNHELEKIIYHPTLKVSVPISTYFLLEGDHNQSFKINYSLHKKEKKNKNVVVVDNVNTISINHNLIVSHEESLLFNEQRQYKINLRLLRLLKKIGNNKILSNIFSHISNNIEITKSNDLWLNFAHLNS